MTSYRMTSYRHGIRMLWKFHSILMPGGTSVTWIFNIHVTLVPPTKKKTPSSTLSCETLRRVRQSVKYQEGLHYLRFQSGKLYTFLSDHPHFLIRFVLDWINSTGRITAVKETSSRSESCLIRKKNRTSLPFPSHSSSFYPSSLKVESNNLKKSYLFRSRGLIDFQCLV